MQTISLTKREKDIESKAKVWEALGRKYKADELQVYNKGEDLPDDTIVVAKYGYGFVWAIEEDDIRVFGDGKGSHNHTFLKADETIYLPKSCQILELALNCLKEIEANRKKYYHI